MMRRVRVVEKKEEGRETLTAERRCQIWRVKRSISFEERLPKVRRIVLGTTRGQEGERERGEGLLRTL
jgi:hypothetical protein